MPELEGRVAFVTGAANGQGRSHAARLAAMGADVALVDIAGGAGLDEAARSVEQAGRKALPLVADVRDSAAMQAAADETLAALGHVAVVCANAGINQVKPATTVTADDWDRMIGVNLTGAWNTVSPFLGPLVERGEGGSIVITSSAAALKGPPFMAHYTASKAGLIGLTRALATELGPHRIRVNCVAPTMVDTAMVHTPEAYATFRPDLENPTKDDLAEAFMHLNALPVPWLEAVDVTEAVAWLVSDEARYVTGAIMPVDAGTLLT